MSIDNREWLKSTNNFALSGIKFLYISNAGAIIAILANINHLTYHPNYPILQCALTMFVLEVIFALVTNFLGYVLYRNLLIAKQNKIPSNDKIWGIVAICAAVFSLFFFGLGAFKAISIIA